LKITRVFFGVHMGLAFQGLGAIAKTAKTKLDEDSCVVFLNRKTNAFKLMVGGAYLTYYKNGNRKIPLDALSLLPEKFGGSRMEIDDAIRNYIVKKLGIQKEK